MTAIFCGHVLGFSGLIPGVDGDRELVLALRRREPGAFEQLYARCREPVWRFLCRVAGPWAEDLFQETWLAAARHVHRLREDTALLSWLFTIARNKYRNGLRGFARQSRSARELGEQPDRPSPLPDEEAAARRLTERARVAFTRLPEAHREVLSLCVVEGLAAAEAARILSCTEAGVRTRLSRAGRELARLGGRNESTEGEA